MSLLPPDAPSATAITSFVVLTVAVSTAIAASVSIAEHAAQRGPGDRDAEQSGRSRPALSSRTLRVAAGLSAWLAVTWIAGASGILGRFDVVPPPLLVFVGATALASVALAFSSLGTLLAHHLPLVVLVGLQGFRVPLEMILHRLSRDGVLPVQMTYDGMNFDIVSGILAIVVALWAAVRTPPRVVLAAWNLIGFVLLLVIVTIAILSAPVPFRVFENEPANTIVTTAPFVWLPTVLVQAAWIGHLLMFRRLRFEKLRLRRQREAPAAR